MPQLDRKERLRQLVDGLSLVHYVERLDAQGEALFIVGGPQLQCTPFLDLLTTLFPELIAHHAREVADKDARMGLDQPAGELATQGRWDTFQNDDHPRLSSLF